MIFSLVSKIFSWLSLDLIIGMSGKLGFDCSDGTPRITASFLGPPQQEPLFSSLSDSLLGPDLALTCESCGC